MPMVSFIAIRASVRAGSGVSTQERLHLPVMYNVPQAVQVALAQGHHILRSSMPVIERNRPNSVHHRPGQDGYARCRVVGAWRPSMNDTLYFGVHWRNMNVCVPLAPQEINQRAVPVRQPRVIPTNRYAYARSRSANGHSTMR